MPTRNALVIKNAAGSGYAGVEARSEFLETGRLIVSNPDARTKDLAHLLIK